MSTLHVKICGMTEKENILSVSEINPGFLGFIFYPASKRFIGDIEPENMQVPAGIKKVGVFVNSSKENIISKVEKYKLDLVQLHGDEKPEQCKELSEEGLKVIKAFSIDEPQTDETPLLPCLATRCPAPATINEDKVDILKVSF